MFKNKGKKIVMVGTFPPIIGGVSSHIFNLSKKLALDGVEVTIFDTISKTNSSYFNVKKANTIPLLLIAFFSSLKQGYNNYHFHTSERAYPLIFLLPFLKIFKCKITLSIHSGNYVSWLLKPKLRFIFYSFILKQVDEIILMNRVQKKELNKLLNIKQIHSVTPFIIPDKKWLEIKNTYKFQFPLKITTMGLWQTIYRFEDVIKATSEIANLSFPIHLEIVAGTAFLESSYKAKILRYIENRENDFLTIRIIENQSNVLEYLENRDMLIRANSTDSFGLCVAEALLVGIPAIATDICPRPDSTKFYSVGKVEKLKHLIIEVQEELSLLKYRKSFLSIEDDAYTKIVSLYNL